jgi:hypothetical protein
MSIESPAYPGDDEGIGGVVTPSHRGTIGGVVAPSAVPHVLDMDASVTKHCNLTSINFGSK